MITTVVLGYTSITSHNYLFFLWWEHLRSTLSNFQVYNTVLLSVITIIVYIKMFSLLIFCGNYFYWFLLLYHLYFKLLLIFEFYSYPYRPYPYKTYPCCSVAKSCLTLCNPMDQSKPGLPVRHWSLSKFMFIELVMPSNHLNPLLPSSPSALNLSSIRVFSNESAVGIRWPKYWSFSISPSKEHLGLISFRIDWFDLLAVQGTLKSLLQHHNLKASILWHSAFFMVCLSHLYMTAGKTITLTVWTFVGKMTSLLFNILSRFVIAFLLGTKCL